MLSSAAFIRGARRPSGMLHPLFRRLLFKLDPEIAHELAFAWLDVAAAIGLARIVAPRVPPSPVKAMGLDFPNRVGLAAGLDKNASHVGGLASLGFGFIECGTVTPLAQPGNAKPRMFRLENDEALINRLGFTNHGVDAFVANVIRARYRGILGVNIGKNFDTPNERATGDYLTCLRSVYPYASYVTVNVSSPNTEGLRDLQHDSSLDLLLGALKAEQTRLEQKHRKKTPLVVKIAPDLTTAEIRHVARILVAHRIDGVIATNTTVDRRAVGASPYAKEQGGLSGRPLFTKSTAVIRILAKELGGAMPIIGVGGIMSGADAKATIAAGATLVQICTGLIYKGPELVAEIGEALAE